MIKISLMGIFNNRPSAALPSIGAACDVLQVRLGRPLSGRLATFNGLRSSKGGHQMLKCQCVGTAHWPSGRFLEIPKTVVFRGALILLSIYKTAVSPLLFFMGARCRFHPSCSAYSRAAFESYGFCEALWLSAKRLIKCGPWHEGGIDELPIKRTCAFLGKKGEI